MPTQMGLLLPWQLSPTLLVALLLAAGLYLRGGARMVPRPPPLRRAAFLSGLGLIYLALQTSWDYYASHMFSVLQLQHFALHDLAPALLACAAPGAALANGVPKRLRARCEPARRPVQALARVLLDPRVAMLLYVGSLLIWLWPPVTFAVMVSNGLYKLMSWTALLGALPFWHLVLDPRSGPLARLRLRHRFALLYRGMAPMMLVSASLAFSTTDWYPVYAVCGRFAPISAVADQQLAGLAMWVPGGLLFGVVFVGFLGRRFERQGMPPARTRLRSAGSG